MMTYAFQSLKHFRCDKQNPLNQLFAIFALFFVLLSAIKCRKIFFDKRKSDVKSNSIKFELRFIDTGNINLTICEIFEIFRADSSQRFFIFIDHFTEKSFLNFVKISSIWWKNFETSSDYKICLTLVEKYPGYSVFVQGHEMP